MPEKNPRQPLLKTILTIAISLVWLINGLFCKVLDMVPRHREIVARILGEDISYFATKAIGVSEILVFIWILSGIKSRWCALFQIIIVATMNTIEFFQAPDLLLYGRANAIVATFFITVVFLNEFVIGKTNGKLAK
jgi:uncharacterized membrane protein YphA (DoxX/SURF4 family)